MKKLAIIVCLIGLLIGSTLGGLALADKGGDPNYGSSPLGEIEEISDKIDNLDQNGSELLEGIGNVTERLDNPDWGLQEIKSEVASIEGNITDPVFGLAEIKSEIAAIEIMVGNISDKVNEEEIILIIEEPPFPPYMGNITDQGYDWDTFANAMGEMKNEIAYIEEVVGNISDKVHTETIEEIILEVIEVDVPKMQTEQGNGTGASDIYDYGSEIRHVHLTVVAETLVSSTINIEMRLPGMSVSANVDDINLEGLYTYEFDASWWSIDWTDNHSNIVTYGATVMYVSNEYAP